MTIEKKEKSPGELKRREGQARQFKNKIRRIFVLSDFKHIKSEGHQFKIGNRDVELDAIFYHKNILIICEATSTRKTKDIKEHARGKEEAFKQIGNHRKEFFEWIQTEFQDIPFPNYEENQYIIKYLYFSQYELGFGSDESNLFPSITFVEPKYLEYFNKMAQCIHKSIKYELYRFLNITNDNIGDNSTESLHRCISATIISPNETTGLSNGVRIVSFMMSAETLIKNSYVLRKDNWEASVMLYQRLIQKEKIKGIRKFLVDKEETFYNNIIVALPKDVYFLNNEQKPLSINDVGKYNVCNMMIPDKMNSICIIDGQHRVYAHYEGEDDDPDEQKIGNLRKKLHLLVTGLVFPEGMSDIQKLKIESEIFLDINANAKPVSPDVLLHIMGVKEPLSDIGLARAVIERLNKEELFLHKFELSTLETRKIKIASIIKFALKYLVTVQPNERKSLYSFWPGNKEALLKLDDMAYNDYLDYCAKKIREYFSAVKYCFQQDWDDPNSKLLSVISINGFIIAYNRFIDKGRIEDFEFFKGKIKNLKTVFSKDSFPYTSSQYKKFSTDILEVLLQST
jgi:dgqhr domain protein